MRRTGKLALANVERDAFCDELAEKGPHFSIWLWMALESRERGSSDRKSDAGEESENGDGEGEGDVDAEGGKEMETHL